MESYIMVHRGYNMRVEKVWIPEKLVDEAIFIEEHGGKIIPIYKADENILEYHTIVLGDIAFDFVRAMLDRGVIPKVYYKSEEVCLFIIEYPLEE